MSDYKHILVGLDFSPDESKTVATKAKALATKLGAKISLAHVIEPLTFAYAGDIPVDLSETQNAMEQHATQQLTQFAQSTNIEAESLHVVIGQTAEELRYIGKEIGADLIVIGTHGRHGLALLLGSTASDVLHGTKCDVLAVYV